MPFKNKKDRQKYQRDWAKRKRNGITTRLKPKFTEQEKKASIITHRKKWGIITRAKRLSIKKKYCGYCCKFCGYKKRLIAHRKDGMTHKPFHFMGLKKHEEEFKTGNYISVCYKCHKSIHWCMDILKMSWKDIEDLVTRTQETSGSSPGMSIN